MSRNKPLTPDQVKARFRARGETLTAWAIEHGYPRQAVYRVLNGQLKANFGTAHDIAVALGLKVEDEPSYSTTQPSTAAHERNAQARKVA